MRQVMEATEQETVVTAWCERDHEHAVLPADREVIDGSRSIRALVVDLAISNGAGDELYDACAVLGRLMGDLGASPLSHRSRSRTLARRWVRVTLLGRPLRAPPSPRGSRRHSSRECVVKGCTRGISRAVRWLSAKPRSRSRLAIRQTMTKSSPRGLVTSRGPLR
jgi:hypothetical protein